MDRRAVAGGLFRSLLVGGSWVRLLTWRKARPGRRIALTVDDEGFKLELVEGGTSLFDDRADTFEGVTHMAVTALGKNL